MGVWVGKWEAIEVNVGVVVGVHVVLILHHLPQGPFTGHDRMTQMCTCGDCMHSSSSSYASTHNVHLPVRYVTPDSTSTGTAKPLLHRSLVHLLVSSEASINPFCSIVPRAAAAAAVQQPSGVPATRCSSSAAQRSKPHRPAWAWCGPRRPPHIHSNALQPSTASPPPDSPTPPLAWHRSRQPRPSHQHLLCKRGPGQEGPTGRTGYRGGRQARAQPPPPPLSPPLPHPWTTWMQRHR